MRLALDAMGGDYAPDEILAGAVAWKEKFPEAVELILVGAEPVIQAKLQEFKADPSLFTIAHADEVIGMEESPALAIRKKKNASIVVANKLVKAGQADAIISFGSTGAQMAAAVFILGRLPNIERPPIVGLLPWSSPTLLVDIGANIDCTPEQLVQFGILGSIYMQHIKNIAHPRVGLLNNGTEESKGNSATQNAYQLFKNQPDLNFIGNIEGRDLFSDQVDVLVCDGFVGNIVLKTLEGMVKIFSRQNMQEVGKVPSFLQALNHRNIGGTPLLGVNGISIVGHGISKRDSVVNGLSLAKMCVDIQLLTLQKKALQEMHAKHAE